MDAGGAGIDGRERVGDGHAAIAVAVPVDADPAAAVLDDARDEAHERRGAGRRGVTDGIGDADAMRAGADRGAVDAAQRFRIGAGRVFRHQEDRQPFLDRERHRRLGRPFEVIDGPVLDVLPQRARPDERRDLDRHAGALRDLGDRRDVVDHRARRRVRPQLHPAIDDLPRDALDIRRDRRARRRQADVGGVHAERFHQVEDFELALDAGGLDRRTLQAVAQRLVIQHHRRPDEPAADGVPIVGEGVHQCRPRVSVPAAWSLPVSG